jgi:hypothetical protein
MRRREGNEELESAAERTNLGAKRHWLLAKSDMQFSSLPTWRRRRTTNGDGRRTAMDLG